MSFFFHSVHKRIRGKRMGVLQSPFSGIYNKAAKSDKNFLKDTKRRPIVELTSSSGRYLFQRSIGRVHESLHPGLSG